VGWFVAQCPALGLAGVTGPEGVVKADRVVSLRTEAGNTFRAVNLLALDRKVTSGDSGGCRDSVCDPCPLISSCVEARRSRDAGRAYHRDRWLLPRRPRGMT